MDGQPRVIGICTETVTRDSQGAHLSPQMTGRWHVLSCAGHVLVIAPQWVLGCADVPE
jgi:hypothetical protein